MSEKRDESEGMPELELEKVLKKIFHMIPTIQ
jgi:hypothetical protein